MERKTVKFEIKAVDAESGILEGYGATFSETPDSYGDVIDRGAFTRTLKNNADSIVSLFNHNVNEPIGLPELKQDQTGLYVKIKLVMEIEKARDVLALARAGVVKRMSIGYDTIKSDFIDGVRHLKEVKLYDVSPVVFAANPEARILAVKAATTFDDLPLADRDRGWDAGAAEKRVRAWAGGDNPSWDKYRRASMWFDSDDPEMLGSYKLGFADIVDGKLTAIPRGIFAIAAVLMGSRGGVNIPEADQTKVKAHCEKYYAKMRKQFEDEGIIPPWDKAAAEPGEQRSDGDQNGRALSAANISKMRVAAIEALRALLDASGEEEDDSEKSTHPAPQEHQELASLDTAIAELKAENEGFDKKEAEARIDSILAQLKK